jgi:hypothetical protein
LIVKRISLKYCCQFFFRHIYLWRIDYTLSYRLTRKGRIMATIGDVVLVYHKDRASFFARIDSIEPDMKKGWYNVQLLILTLPIRSVTWILREEYLNGIPFTMEGSPVRIEAVKPLPAEPYLDDTDEEPSDKSPPRGGRKVIPFKRTTKGSAKET